MQSQRFSIYLLLALPCEASREKKTALLYGCTIVLSFLMEINSNITLERFQTLGWENIQKTRKGTNISLIQTISIINTVLTGTEE